MVNLKCPLSFSLVQFIHCSQNNLEGENKLFKCKTLIYEEKQVRINNFTRENIDYKSDQIRVASL